VIGWIFFDWAAQPYFTLITAVVFGRYFAAHVASDSPRRPHLRSFDWQPVCHLHAANCFCCRDGRHVCVPRAPE